MNNVFKKSSPGLSLIETMIGLSVITVAVVSMVGTGIYSFSTYQKSIYRFTALGLAQEGVEVVRNIRDDNWLPPNTINYCGDIGADQYCYTGWHTNLTSCALGCQAEFNTVTNTWVLNNSATSYALYLQDDSKLFTKDDNGSDPVFYRKIRITSNTSEPYSADHPELKVLSTVAWVGRGCLNDFAGDPENAQSRCQLSVEDRLTNWKNY